MVSKSAIGIDLKNQSNWKRLVALDLGTTKFCLAQVTYSPNNIINGIKLSHTTAEGMHRGMLSDKAKASRSLLKLIEIHEEEFQQDVRDVVVGIAGTHLKGQKILVSKKIPKVTVSNRDISDLNREAVATINNSFREVLHVIPVNYQLDTRHIENPVGSHGDTLSCEFFVIDADRGYLKDVIDLCNESGLIIKKFYSEPFASASAILVNQFYSPGTCIVDIGGGTSDGIIFINNQPARVFTINIAGKMMTNDLSIGLGVPISDAEMIKRNLCSGANEFYVTDLYGDPKTVGRWECMKILLPRLLELSYMINKEISPYRELLTGGIVLTGGGSEVTDLLSMLQKICNLPTRRIQPSLSIGHQGEMTGKNEYGGPLSTVLGLLNLEISSLSDMTSTPHSRWSNRLIGTFLNWIKELY